MQHCFTPFEWRSIRTNPSNLNAQVNQFFRHWTLKEGYIKAVGIGLGFELLRAEFTLDSNNDDAQFATVKIDGKVKLLSRYDCNNVICLFDWVIQ